MNFVYKIEKEYSESGIPTVIADEELNILWANGIGNFLLRSLGERADPLFDGGAPATGLVSKEIDGETCTFNVIKTSDSANDKSYYIIELVASGKLDGIVSAEAINGYIGYICDKIRTAAGDITSVTDRVFKDISAGILDSRYIAEGFNRIQESVMSLEREVTRPEQIYSLIDPKKPDDVIILDREMLAVVSGIRGCLKGTVRISEDYDRDIFFHMNADSFETAVASMAAECCMMNVYPERIIFSARRSGHNRAEIAVMSLNIGGIPNSGSDSLPAETNGKGFNKKLLAEYIYDVLGLKNGVRFSRESLPNGCLLKMSIEILPRGAYVFTERAIDGSGRRRQILDKADFFFGAYGRSERYRVVPDKASEELLNGDGVPV